MPPKLHVSAKRKSVAQEAVSASPGLTRTVDPEKQKENIAELRAMGVQEVRDSATMENSHSAYLVQLRPGCNKFAQHLVHRLCQTMNNITTG